jgi:hypothetical protein
MPLRGNGTSFKPRKPKNAHTVPTGGSPTIMTLVLAEAGIGRTLCWLAFWIEPI